MLTEIPPEDYAATLDRCADDALWEACVDRPPVDAFRLARALRIEVTVDRAQDGRARFVRPRGGGGRSSGGVIVLGAEPRPERRQWAVAHEVGEAIAHRVFETLDVSPTDAPKLAREGVANALAGRLLAPRGWLVGVDRDSDGNLPQIKSVFRTASHELLARRLLECRRGGLIVTVYDNDAVAWRRWNLAGRAPVVQPMEEACQREAHATGAPSWRIGYADEAPAFAQVRGWPIHEPDWRREIVFAELNDFA